MPEVSLPPILSRDAAAALLGIAPATLHRWESERRIPFSRLSQKVTLYVLDDLVAFVRSKTVPPLGAMPRPSFPRTAPAGTSNVFAAGVPPTGSMRKPPNVLKTTSGWRIDYRVGGKRVRRRYRDKSEAERTAAEVYLRQMGTTPMEARPEEPTQSPLFRDAAHNHMELVTPEHTASTVDRDRIHIESMLVPEFGDRPVAKITTAEITAFRNKRAKAMSPATVNRDLSLLSAIFRNSMQTGLVKDNPVKRVKRLHEASKEARPLSRDEAKRLIEAAETPLRELIIVALFTGMRPGELFHLRWVDCNFEGKFVEVVSRKDFVTKTKRSRRIPMNADVAQALRSVRDYHARARLISSSGQPAELVFPDEATGQAHSRIRASWEAVCRKARIEPRRFYDLRHSFGSWASLAGEDLFSLQRWMGHASIVTTQRYARHRPQEFRGKLDDLTLG
jgi:integrase